MSVYQRVIGKYIAIHGKGGRNIWKIHMIIMGKYSNKYGRHMADILGTYDCCAWEYRPVISIIWENQNGHIKNNMDISTMGIYGNISNNSQMKLE